MRRRTYGVTVKCWMASQLALPCSNVSGLSLARSADREQTTIGLALPHGAFASDHLANAAGAEGAGNRGFSNPVRDNPSEVSVGQVPLSSIPGAGNPSAGNLTGTPAVDPSDLPCASGLVDCVDED